MDQFPRYKSASSGGQTPSVEADSRRRYSYCGSRNARFATHPQCRPAASDRALVRFLILEQLFARDFLLGHVGEFEDEIDHLVFKDRGAKLGHSTGIVAIVVPDLLLASRHLARALDHRAADFVVGD